MRKHFLKRKINEINSSRGKFCILENNENYFVLLSFMKSHLLIAGLNAYSLRVLDRMSFLVLLSSNIFPTFSCPRFRISGLMLRLLVHLELSFAEAERKGVSFLLLVSRAPFVEDILFSLVLYC